MAEYVTVWPWTSDAEGWTLSGFQYYASDGTDFGGNSDPGCLETVTDPDEAGGSARTRTLTLTGLTWEDLGLPAGETVSAVAANFRLKLYSVFGPFIEVACSVGVYATSDDSLIALAYTNAVQRTGMVTGNWITCSGSPASVDAAYEDSTTGIYLKITLSSGSNAISYGWEFRIDTLEVTLTGTGEEGSGSDTVKIPLTERGFTMPILSKSGVGLGNIAAYDYVTPVTNVTAATWKILCACDVDPGVTARLNVYTGWYGEDGFVTESNSPSLSNGSYTELSFAMSAGQLADPLFVDALMVAFSLRMEITAGSGGAAAYIVSVHLEVTGEYPSLSEVAWGMPAPTDWMIDGTWHSSGPAMQNQPVTLLMQCLDRPGNPFGETGILRTVHVLTDGGGGWAYYGNAWATAVTVLAGWWYMDDTEPFSDQRLKPAITNGFSPASLQACASPSWMTPPDLALRMARYSRFFVTNNVTYAWDHITTSPLLNTTYHVGTETSDYTPKLKFFGSCQNGGAFDMDGVSVDVVGTYGTETLTLNSQGEAPLTSVDPQVIQSFTNVTVLPACGSLRTFPPYTTPAGVNRGDLVARYPAVSASASFGLTHRAWFVPPNCGVNVWIEPLLFCTSCSGTIDSLRINVDTHDPTGHIVVAWINDSGALKVAINPQPELCVELEDGKLGWLPAVTLESSNASDIGMIVLPSDIIYVCYDLSGAKKYRTTRKMGHGTAGDWTAAATPSPAVSRHSDQSRGAQTGARWRATATGSIITGTGALEFSLCDELTGATWNSPVTLIASGVRSAFCGGSWIGSGYGVLWMKDSDDTVYWKTTDNPDIWPAGDGTDLSSVTLQPVGLAYHPCGMLVGLCWDSQGTKGFRACRSYNRGETWEMDSADIAGIPPMTQPAMIVCALGIFFIVWVANDSPCLVYSLDFGNTWQG